MPWTRGVPQYRECGDLTKDETMCLALKRVFEEIVGIIYRFMLENYRFVLKLRMEMRRKSIKLCETLGKMKNVFRGVERSRKRSENGNESLQSETNVV